MLKVSKFPLLRPCLNQEVSDPTSKALLKSSAQVSITYPKKEVEEGEAPKVCHP